LEVADWKYVKWYSLQAIESPQGGRGGLALAESLFNWEGRIVRRVGKIKREENALPHPLRKEPSL